MNSRKKGIYRRSFLKFSGTAALGALLNAITVKASGFSGDFLQVWSCGGLADAFIPANAAYEELNGVKIVYTGAFAAALGKSLMGHAKTEVFAPRVLELAKKLKSQGKMLEFFPLCFTRYVIITPEGNPAKIREIKDLALQGVRVVLSSKASPPGAVSEVILKKAGILEGIKKKAVKDGDCVQRIVPWIVNGRADAAVVELRLTQMPKFKGRVEYISIPEEYIPPKPITFTIGVMKWAHNKDLAYDFVRFILSEKGQSFFSRAGFIPAQSEEGQRLVKKYGVYDV